MTASGVEYIQGSSERDATFIFQGSFTKGQCNVIGIGIEDQNKVLNEKVAELLNAMIENIQQENGPHASITIAVEDDRILNEINIKKKVTVVKWDIPEKDAILNQANNLLKKFNEATDNFFPFAKPMIKGVYNPEMLKKHLESIASELPIKCDTTEVLQSLTTYITTAKVSFISRQANIPLLEKVTNQLNESVSKLRAIVRNSLTEWAQKETIALHPKRQVSIAKLISTHSTGHLIVLAGIGHFFPLQTPIKSINYAELVQQALFKRNFMLICPKKEFHIKTLDKILPVEIPTKAAATESEFKETKADGKSDSKASESAGSAGS